MTKFKIVAPALALAAILLSGTVACSAGKPNAGPVAPAGSDQEQALKFAQCMRDHGVDMPDPRDGHMVTGDLGTPGTINGSGAVELPNADGAAFQACREFLPNGGEPRKLTAAELEQGVRYAQCMRAHGLDYPDPNPAGALDVPGIPVGDEAAMQRMEDAARECDAVNSPAPAK
ncbi:hypothetical protein [Dactylosporangium sp. NPDC048998]|uniref:hypothetical protein n=1 Tax=Dactylosporangium sp. NPDC048998 TaxID=3363976 RepID=UPI003723382D